MHTWHLLRALLLVHSTMISGTSNERMSVAEGPGQCELYTSKQCRKNSWACICTVMLSPSSMVSTSCGKQMPCMFPTSSYIRRVIYSFELPRDTAHSMISSGSSGPLQPSDRAASMIQMSWRPSYCATGSFRSSCSLANDGMPRSSGSHLHPVHVVQ